MPELFEHAFALLIGVSKQKNPERFSSLDAVEKDIYLLEQIFKDPNHSAYPSNQVISLTGESCTKDEIFDALDGFKRKDREC